MSDDSFTEVTSTSWFGRIGNSIKGILFGLVLFVGSFVLLFWNEGRAVKRAKALEEGAKVAISVDAASVLPANEGKLVHMTGMTATDDVLNDPVLGVSTNAIKLSREVEMYQWVEKKETKTEKKVGGGEKKTTTYNYAKEWKSSPVNSSSFKKPTGHENPGMPVRSETFSASNVSLGGYQLGSSIISSLSNYESLQVDSIDSAPFSGNVTRYGEGFYVGNNSSSPEIGDLRINFEVVLPSTISVLAKQSGQQLGPYTTSNGGNIELVQQGTHTKDAMFKKAEADNAMLTWILRLVGFLLMGFGLSLVFKPLSVLADVIPFIGDLVGAATGFVAFGIAFVLSLITIAIAWIAYRPVLAVALIAVAVGAFFMVKNKAAVSVPKPQST